jgi:hypothetical protein
LRNSWRSSDAALTFATIFRSKSVPAPNPSTSVGGAGETVGTAVSTPPVTVDGVIKGNVGAVVASDDRPCQVPQRPRF